MDCKLEQSENFFTISGKKRLRCQQCNIKRCSAWYERNKQRKQKNSLARYERQNNLLRNLKKIPCKDCKKEFPAYVMHFDHLYDKKFNLSKAQQRNWEEVLKEVSKCEIVCANCHQIRTHKRWCVLEICTHE